MSQESSNRLLEQLWGVITYFEKEYDMTYAEVIGCVEMIKASLVEECMEISDEQAE